MAAAECRKHPVCWLTVEDTGRTALRPFRRRHLLRVAGYLPRQFPRELSQAAKWIESTLLQPRFFASVVANSTILRARSVDFSNAIRFAWMSTLA